MALISALLGSVFGLLGSIGGAMKFSENKLNVLSNKQKKEQKSKQIKCESEFFGSVLGDIYKKSDKQKKDEDEWYTFDNVTDLRIDL